MVTPGKIAVIHGPMFSGKTEELLRRIRRAKIARRRVQIFKPEFDNRYSARRVIPHHLAANSAGEAGEEAVCIDHSARLYDHLDPLVQTVGIEEAQFFDIGLLDVVLDLSNRGIDVVLSLLDQDFRRMPFPIAGSHRNVGEYLAICHESLKLTAICLNCGQPAHHTQKLVFIREYPPGKPLYVPASFHSKTVAVGTSLDIEEERQQGRTEQANTLSSCEAASEVSGQGPLADDQSRPADSALTGTVEPPGDAPHEVYEARCSKCHELPDRPEKMWS